MNNKDFMRDIVALKREISAIKGAKFYSSQNMKTYTTNLSVSDFNFHLKKYASGLRARYKFKVVATEQSTNQMFANLFFTVDSGLTEPGNRFFTVNEVFKDETDENTAFFNVDFIRSTIASDATIATGTVVEWEHILFNQFRVSTTKPCRVVYLGEEL